MTAKLYSIQRDSEVSVSSDLRRIADEIDSGRYGETFEAVLVLGGGMHVAALSGTGPLEAYYLLGRAQRKMERIDLMDE